MNSSITFKTSLVALEIYFSYLHKFSRLSWYLRLLSLVAIYSGPSTSVEILNYIFTFRGTSHTVNLVFSFFCWLRDKRAMCFPRGSWRGVGEGRSHFPSAVCYEILLTKYLKIPFPIFKKNFTFPVALKKSHYQWWKTWKFQFPALKISKSHFPFYPSGPFVLPLRTLHFTPQDPSFYPSGPFILPFRTLHFIPQDLSFYPSRHFILPLRTFRFTPQGPSFYPSGPFILPSRTLFHAKYQLSFSCRYLFKYKRNCSHSFQEFLTKH